MPTKRSCKRSSPGMEASISPNKKARNSENSEGTGDTSDIASDTVGEEGEEGEEVNDRTVSKFSIHWIRVGKPGVDRGKEEERIETIMEQINEKLLERNQTAYQRKETKVRPTPAETEVMPPPSETNFESSARKDFRVAVYTQTIKRKHAILDELGVDHEVSDVNYVVFHHRENEIFASTFGNSWQHIQSYCCYDFPLKISGRLTSSEGNVEESTKPLVGNVIVSKILKKNPTQLDQLRNIRLNVTKYIRDNCSLLWLDEFQKNSKRRGWGKVKMRFGFAYVRIERQMELKNLPQILDHFSKIYKGEDTLTYEKPEGKPYPEGKPEDHRQEEPFFQITSYEKRMSLENDLSDILFRFIHTQDIFDTNLIKTFVLVDKRIESFCSATDFRLTYNTGKKSTEIDKFSLCPSFIQVMQMLRTKCAQLKDATKTETFYQRLKNNVKLCFKVGKNEYRTSIFQLIEGEVRDEDSHTYFKLMGNWYSISEEYYLKLHEEFFKFLKKPGLLVSNVDLTIPFDFKDAVQPYVAKYKNEPGYFIPPIQTREGLVDDRLNQYFDLLHVRRNGKMENFFKFFYIFDCFGPTIRDASTRLNKACDMLLKEKGPFKSWLRSCWKENPGLQEIFSKFDEFYRQITTHNNVTIVVAFVKGKVSQGLEVLPTLMREKELELKFTESNLEEMLSSHVFVDDHSLRPTLCQQLDCDDKISHIANKLKQKLQDEGYGGIETTKSGDAIPIRGKLLKLSDSKDFKLFGDYALDQAIFKGMREKFLTGFPGITHKLEFLQICENLASKALAHQFIEIEFIPGT